MKFWLLTRPQNQAQKLAMLADYFEEEEKEEEEQQQQPASAKVVITNNGQRNQPNCSAICVLLTTKQMAQCARCDVDLCVVPCFAEYHTKVNLQYITLFVNTVCRDKSDLRCHRPYEAARIM